MKRLGSLHIETAQNGFIVRWDGVTISDSFGRAAEAVLVATTPDMLANHVRAWAQECVNGPKPPREPKAPRA